jgi:Fic-DOC domain mobile mystery protein B
VGDPLFDADDAANTPLALADREGLVPTYITTRDQLNEAEQENILQADRWAFARRRSVADVGFLIGLHRRMLRSVWRWAGTLRKTAVNIGIEPRDIEVELHQLVGDVKWWIDNQTYSPDEIAVRFHHRLVAIHPFPNGNGRHSRMAADLLVVQLGGERFTWGREGLVKAAATRSAYVKALQAADRHDISALLTFARS